MYILNIVHLVHFIIVLFIEPSTLSPEAMIAIGVSVPLGIIVAVVVLLLLIPCLLVCYTSYKKKRKYDIVSNIHKARHCTGVIIRTVQLRQSCLCPNDRVVLFKGLATPIWGYIYRLATPIWAIYIIPTCVQH